MVKLSDILVIERNRIDRGYEIKLKDGRSIFLTKRRTIIALLLLIHYGTGCEADLAQGTKRIPEIKRILRGKIPENYIQEYYGDANKPFSELWNEEGFSFISNPTGKRRERSQEYLLDKTDHAKLFTVSKKKKAYRKPPSNKEKDEIRRRQKKLCNLCGAKVMKLSEVPRHSFSKDRRKERFDHRVPVEKGGKSDIENYQLLCCMCLAPGPFLGQGLTQGLG